MEHVEVSEWTTQRVECLLSLQPGNTPAALHRSFEEELGYINSHLCIADVALRDLEAAARANQDLLRQRARANGHRRLNTTYLQVDSALELSYISQIALLLGRMDHLCGRLQSHPLVNRTLKGSAKGDYLRKALWVILQSQSVYSGYQFQTPLDDACLNLHLPEVERLSLDRFRELRNAQFHPTTSRDALTRTRFSEVLECSKALQSISMHLCRTLGGPPEVLAHMISKRFGYLSNGRRRHAARATLEQEYLLDGPGVNEVLFNLAW
jgi:hypothetical protein